jgi:DNA repair photolyase
MADVIKGRGTALNPTNRFEKLAIEEGEYVQHVEGEELPDRPRTIFYEDPSRSILTKNESPDVGFTYSVNPYRGCEHGCIYCFARPTHEYLGMSAGLDFETKILVKKNAPALLREKLLSRSWQPESIALSGVTDCYQPVERKLEITRQCLRVLADFRNPFFIITKNHLVTRDLDILKEMAEVNGAGVFISVTTLDPKLAQLMEPRTSHPEARLRAIEELAKAGVPVGSMVAPVVPGLTDHEMPHILKAVSSAGAKFAGYVPIRLPFVLDDLFSQWLEQHFPDRKAKVLNRIREIRGGKLNDGNFGSRMTGEGIYAGQLQSMFSLYTKKEGLNLSRLDLTVSHFRRPSDQMDFFDS